MTRTPTILAAEYDAPAQLAASLYVNGPKRAMVAAELERAEAAADEESARLMRWELAMLDLVPVTGKSVSPWRGGTYEQYAEAYRLTPDTVSYAIDRARETNDLRLKLRYLEFALFRTTPTGISWIQLQRELLRTYRDYVDGCRIGAGRDAAYHAGVYIEHTLIRVGQLLSIRGVVAPADAPSWAEWIVRLAEDSRSFPVDEAGAVLHHGHRWIADYLRVLTALPTEATGEPLRERALALLAEAAAFYQTTPQIHYFEHVIAEAEAELRKHWGEEGTHKRMIRRQFEATLRRAEFERSHGSDLIAAEFFRQARGLAVEHRQYFTDAEIAQLGRAEQEALVAGADEFTRVRIPIEVPKALMDYIRDTPEATAQAIVAEAAAAVPNRARIRKDVLEGLQQAPLQAVVGRTIVAPGKVVGQTAGGEDNVELEVQSRAMIQTLLLAIGVADAVIRAAQQVGLSPEHLTAALAPLRLDEGTIALIQHGLGRLIVGDPVSATHVITPRIEDALRQHLNAIGFDTTEFRADEGRTDDSPLGSLMRKKLPDGRSVRDYLGPDLWDHFDSVLNRQTGLNLRHDFAHGLARPAQCTPANAAIALMLLYQLAAAAGRGWPADGHA